MPVLKYKDGNEWKVVNKNVAYEKDNTLFRSMVDRSITEVKVEDLQGITVIGDNAFYNSHLTSITLPNTITHIFSSAFSDTLLTSITLPNSITSIGGSAFNNCSSLTSITLLSQTVVTLKDTFYNCNKLTDILVPAKLLNAYKNDSKWTKYADNIKPYDSWVPETTNQIMLFNRTKTITIDLMAYTEIPTYSITSNNTEMATISNINATLNAITFDLTTLSIEGNCSINISISNDDITYDRSFQLAVYETIPESTYTISAIDGATYGFTLNDSGYYESTNKAVNASYSLCRVNINNTAGKKVYFDCISYGESNYDYGILSAVNQELAKSNTTDKGVKKSFKGLSKADVQTVEYTDATGDCFIDVKYVKDSSGNQGNDSLQFKVRFEEV